MSAAFMRQRRAHAQAISIMLRADIFQPRPGWREHRKCAGVDPNVFFDRRIKQAEDLCATCPVRVDCTADCVQVENREGVPSDLLVGYRGVSASMRRHFRVGVNDRPVDEPVGSQSYPRQDVADIACRAHAAGVRMASAVAEHFGIAERAATNLIRRTRLAGWEIPFDRQPPRQAVA